MKEERRPSIAIILPNTLARLGLATLISRMMPSADIHQYSDFEKLGREPDDRFYHYFISTQVLLEHVAFFLQRASRTIVLTQGTEQGYLPQGLHTVNVFQDEEQLVRDFLHMAHTAHTAHGETPAAVRLAQQPEADAPKLTPRERDVLRGIVMGQRNKEIACELNVTPTTVISHRKHLTEKLRTKSVASLTLYAVLHGIVSTDEI